jgi:hypothetical protein
MTTILRFFLILLPFFCYFLAHYIAANAYATVCTPLTLQGFLMSFITTSRPFCNRLLVIINYTNSSYAAIVASLLTLAVTHATSWMTTVTARGG